MSTDPREHAPIDETEVAEHVETLRSLLPNQPGLVAATRGAASAPPAIPDHTLAAMIKMPERPKGMGIQEWLKLLAAFIQFMLNNKDPNAPA